MRKRKNYKERVAKVYDMASQNKIEWPTWIEAAIANQEYKNYFNNNPPGSGGYYNFIKLLVDEMKPKTVLELGSHYGLGILAVMTTLPKKSKFVTVDIVTDLAGVPEKILSDARFKHYNGNCLDLQTYGEDVPKNIDLLICDTLHSYDQINAEIMTYQKFLADEAVILVDDLDYALTAGGKRKYFNEWQQDKLDLSGYCHSSGYGALFFTRSK